MPQELPVNYQPPQMSNGKNTYGLSQQPTYNSYPQYSSYSAPQTKPQSPQKSDLNYNTNNSDFQRFYGPVSSTTSLVIRISITISK
jgi:hypothetical protein